METKPPEVPAWREGVRRGWLLWCEFSDGTLLNLTGVSPDAAVDAVRAAMNEADPPRTLRGTYHLVPGGRFTKRHAV